MIDWTRVNELRDEIGADNLEEVVAMFLDEADEVIARITQNDSAASLEADLHFLKGAALNLGFAEFAVLCQNGERQAALGQVGLDIAAVQDCYALSKSALSDGIMAQNAA